MPSASVGSRIKDLYKIERGVDVHFLVGPEQGPQKLIAAHKLVLMLASDVFDAMFRFAEEQGRDCIRQPFREPDIKAEVFEKLMEYIYTDGLKSGLDEHNVHDVLEAAQKYNVAGLFRICVDFWHLDVNNVLFILEQAQFLKYQDIIIQCWELIDQNVYDVIETDAFLEMDQKLLGELLERDQLMVYRRPWIGEIALWRAALRWADEQCGRRELDISPENRRQMLGQALYKIRVPLIRKEDFLQEIVPSGILSEEEVNSVTRYQSHPTEPDGSISDKNDQKFPTNPRV